MGLFDVSITVKNIISFFSEKKIRVQSENYPLCAVSDECMSYRIQHISTVANEMGIILMMSASYSLHSSNLIKVWVKIWFLGHN